MKYAATVALLLLAVSAISPQPPTADSGRAGANGRLAVPLPTTFQTSAWDALRQGVQDNDVAHRKSAIAATGTIGAVPEAVKLAGSGLQDKDVLVRQAAAVTLGEMGSSDAIPFLKAALDDNPEVSFSAAEALWELGDRTPREIFQEVIEGDRKDTPGKVRGALRDAKKKLTPSQMALMGTKEAVGALFGPASIGVSAVQEAMKETKKDSGAPGRARAAGALGKDPDPYALTLLEWSLSDGNWAVRLAVAKALGDRGNQDSIPKLMPLLNDDRHAVRYMAAASIIKIGARGSSASVTPSPSQASLAPH